MLRPQIQPPLRSVKISTLDGHVLVDASGQHLGDPYPGQEDPGVQPDCRRINLPAGHYVGQGRRTGDGECVIGVGYEIGVGLTILIEYVFGTG
jgi:hypothetical protein